MITIIFALSCRFRSARKDALSRCSSRVGMWRIFIFLVCPSLFISFSSHAEVGEAVLYTSTATSIKDGDYFVVPAGRTLSIEFIVGDTVGGCTSPFSNQNGNCEEKHLIAVSTPDDSIVVDVPNNLKKVLLWNPTVEDIGTHKVYANIYAEKIHCFYLDQFGKQPSSCEVATIKELIWSSQKTIAFDVIVHDLSIHSIEPTQAIQVEQSPTELAQYLLANDYDPPVPLVAHKPMALRVIPNQVTKQTKAVVEVWTSGPGETIADAELADSKTVLLSPRCSPEERRAQRPDPPATCNSINFFLEDGPPEGKSTIWVYLKYLPKERAEVPATAWLTDLQYDLNLDMINQLAFEPGNTGSLVLASPDGTAYLDGNIVNFDDNHRFTFDVKASDEIVFHPINICIGSAFTSCVNNPVQTLRKGIQQMAGMTPTHSVRVGGASHKMNLAVANDRLIDGDGDECDCFDHTGNKIHDFAGDCFAPHASNRIKICEPIGWWDVVNHLLLRQFRMSGLLNLGPGIESFYFGLALPDEDLTNTGILGTSSGLGGLSAVGLVNHPMTTVVDLEMFQYIVSHEGYHLLGRGHPGVANPVDVCKPALVTRPPADWPYDTNRVQSGHPVPPGDPEEEPKTEIGYDVLKKRVVKPTGSKPPSEVFDVMGYCKPERWISPFTSVKLLERIDPPPPDPVPIPGEYWLVSGAINSTAAFLDPLFVFDSLGHNEVGEGTHQIQVTNNFNATTFIRRFTPHAAFREGFGSGETQPMALHFAEMIPVQHNTGKIAILDNAGSELGRFDISGIAPSVDFTSPSAGETLNGISTISWIVNDPDNSEHTYWLEYSPDNGQSWQTLDQALAVNQFNIDTQALSGSVGRALVRVTASDGINTGSVISGAFSVPKKLPDAEIISPANSDVLLTGEPAFLHGFGYDLDDGILPDTQMQWTSDIDGIIGEGAEIATRMLSEGNHVLSFNVMDSDGNIATDTVSVAVQAESLFEEPLDTDSDGVIDTDDNCIESSNPNQRDSDNDGYGNMCDADLNNDNFVNSLDLGLFKQVFMTTGNVDADLNSDSIVNSLDLGVFKQLFFLPPGPSSLAP